MEVPLPEFIQVCSNVDKKNFHNGHDSMLPPISFHNILQLKLHNLTDRGNTCRTVSVVDILWFISEITLILCS